MENLNLKPANIAKAIRMNNWGPVKKQATRPVAAWLDKQNKQMPVAITSTLPPCFAKRGRRTRLTAGEYAFLNVYYIFLFFKYSVYSLK